MKKGLIFAGGDFSVPQDFDKILAQKPVILCADSGYDNAVAQGIIPNAIIGDMDSVLNKLPDGIKQIKLKCEKDDTDTQSCIDYLIEEGCDEIILLGALGGRADHELANIMLTIYAAKKGAKLIIKSDKSEIFLVSDFTEISGNIGDFLSLIPISEEVGGVSLSGLKYPLSNATLEMGKTIGISNEFIKQKAKVTLKKGLLIAIKTKR